MILAFLQPKTFIATQIKLQSAKNLSLSLCQAISRWQGSFWQLCNQLKLNLVINFQNICQTFNLIHESWNQSSLLWIVTSYNMSSYTITDVSSTESCLRNRKCLFWLFSQSISSFHQFYSEHCFMFYVPVCNFALPCFIIPPRPPIVKVLKQEVKPLCWSDHETTVLQTVNLKRGKGNRQNIWRKSSF